MIARAAALALPVTVTLSLAWSPAFISFFPFMLPLAVLFVGRNYRIDTIPIAFTAVGLLAAVSAIVTGASLGFAALWVALAALYLVARYRLPEVLSTRTLARAFAFVACVVGALAIYQVAQSTTFGSPYNSIATQMRLGMTTSDGSFIQRPVGVFHNSNILGQWLVFATLLLVPIIRAASVPWRVVTAAIVGITLALTYSRAVWVVAVTVALIVLLRWVARSAARVAAACILVAATGLTFLFLGAPEAPSGLLPDRFSVADTQANLGDRSDLNEYGLSVASEHPLVGVGYLQYPDVSGSQILRPHNVFIQMAAEQGFPAAAMLGAVMLVVAIASWRAASRVRRARPLLSGALLALPLAWLGFLLVYSSAADYAVMPLFVVALGYLLSRADEPPGASPEHDATVAAARA